MSELSMRDLFPACVAILNERLAPLHYAELTEQALYRLNLSPHHVNMAKEKENVREKLLVAGQYGTLYTGEPAYAGALRHWFVSDRQISLKLPDEIEIPGNAEAGAVGAFEALMRAPFMAVHNAMIPHTIINMTRASGLVLEQHVSRWFQQQYPTIFQPADNAGDWRSACDHDFKLRIHGRTYGVDVFGPDHRGQYGKRGKKRATDLHLRCRIQGRNCIWDGVVRGEHYQSEIAPDSIFSPTAFLVWLNCAKLGVRYRDVAPGMEGAIAA